MNDKKHIDRIFQEKFKNFEATPDDAVWENIHNALHKDKRKRRLIPLWWYSSGVAAVLVLLLTIGKVFNSSEEFNHPQNNMVGTETTKGASPSNQTKGNEKNNRNSSDHTNDSSNVIANSVQSENDNSKSDSHKKMGNTPNKPATQLASEDSVIRNTNTKTNSEDEVTTSQKDKTVITNSKEEAIAKNTPNLPQLNTDKKVIDQSNEPAKTNLEDEKQHTTIAKATDQNTIINTETLKDYKDIIASNKEDESIEDAIAKADLINEEEKEEQSNRWNISPSVAPVYFNSLGKGSSIDNQFVNNDKNGAVNMSYGINGSYAINDKIKIRAGVNKVNLGYSTDGVVTFKDVSSFNTNFGSSELRNINFNSQGGQNTYQDSYMSSSGINKESAPQFVVSDTKGSLEQQFGYIEVPLEVEYSIIDSKFGLNVIGGFSTLFLNTNEIYSVLDNERSLLGDANNINGTSYSANFGLGLNYNISRSLKLNLEPMFKYQINTFNNTSGDFRPYFIGVYSGFSFKF